jgi:RNA polymerase sigma factor FliA
MVVKMDYEGRDRELWIRMHSEGDASARDELLLLHLPLVRYVATRLLRAGQVDAEFDDLVSAGTIGLINAVETFDPGRGLAFSTLAAPRIRGAILDDLRRRDHGTRGLRKRQRDLARAAAELETETGQPAGAEAIATRLGIEPSKLRQWEREIMTLARVSLDQPLDPEAPGAPSADEILTMSDDSLEQEIERQDKMRILADAIAELTEREQVVISLYYFEDLKLKEIAAVLGVTESRVSQIRSKALRTLREHLVWMEAA